MSETLAQVKAGKRVRNFESELLGSEGARIPVLLSGAPVVLEASGASETVGMVFVVHDNRKAKSLFVELEAKSYELTVVEERLRQQIRGAEQAG